MIVWLLDLQLHVQSVPITARVVCLIPTNGDMYRYSIEINVIKFVIDLLHVSGFLRGCQLLRYQLVAIFKKGLKSAYDYSPQNTT